MRNSYPMLADAVLLLHLLFVLFVVVGLVLIVAGGYLRWSWARNLWFRLVHLAGIVVVVAQSWIGLICPLTTLEMWLREQAGQTAYAGSFIQHWVSRVLYYDAPTWMFMLAYSLFGCLVVIAWLRFPPQKRLTNDGSSRD